MNLKNQIGTFVLLLIAFFRRLRYNNDRKEETPSYSYLQPLY